MPFKILMIAFVPMLAALFSVAAPRGASANSAYDAAVIAQSDADDIVLSEFGEPTVVLNDDDDSDDDDINDRDDDDNDDEDDYGDSHSY